MGIDKPVNGFECVISLCSCLVVLKLLNIAQYLNIQVT